MYVTNITTNYLNELMVFNELDFRTHLKLTERVFFCCNYAFIRIYFYFLSYTMSSYYVKYPPFLHYTN